MVAVITYKPVQSPIEEVVVTCSSFPQRDKLVINEFYRDFCVVSITEDHRSARINMNRHDAQQLAKWLNDAFPRGPNDDELL